MRAPTRFAVVALLLCSGVAHADIELAPTYAAMFKKSQQWTYEVTSSGKTRKVTCSVTNVVDWKRSIATEIACDDSIGEFTDAPEGVWVATSEGLGRPIGRNAMTKMSDALPIAIVMPAKPTAEKPTPKKSSSFKRTSPAKGTWCNVVDDSRATAGYPRIYTVCFSEGVGISSVTVEWTAEKKTDSFVLVPPAKR